MVRKYIVQLFLYSLGLFNLFCCFHSLDLISSYSLNLFSSYIFFLLCFYCCSGNYMLMTISCLSRYSKSDNLEFRCERVSNSGVGMIYVRVVGDLFWHELCYDLCIKKNCTYRSYVSFTEKYLCVGDLLSFMSHSLSRDKGFRYNFNSLHSTNIFLTLLMFVIYLFILFIIWH